MLSSIRRWRTARQEQARAAQRFYYLASRLSELHRWCDGEAALAAQWLMEADDDHWRALGEPSRGKLPSRVEDFREMVRKLRLQKAE